MHGSSKYFFPVIFTYPPSRLFYCLSAMFDKDGNGTINFHEFGALWKYIIDWQNTFRFVSRKCSLLGPMCVA